MANEQMAERRRTILAALLALTITLAVFSPVVHLGYVNWDDTLHVTENPYLNPVTLPHVLHFWQKPYHNLFIPVSYTAYALLALLARQSTPLATPREGVTFYDPHVFHAANLVLHLLNVLLVFLLLRRIVKNPWAALGGSLLFALHPAQVESVAWISELRGLLGSFFSLSALNLYLAFAMGIETGLPSGSPRIGGRGAVRASSPGGGGELACQLGGVLPGGVLPGGVSDTPRIEGRGAVRAWMYAGALACFVLALLAKPSAVVTPLFALLLDAGVARRGLRPMVHSLSGWGIAAACCVLLTHAVQPTPAALDLPLWQRPFIAGDALAFCLAKTLLPWRLGIDYGRAPLSVLSHPWGYLTWLIPVAVGLLLWRVRHRFPVPCLAALLFVAGLLPTLGLVPFLFQSFSTVADRYLYLALLGPALMLAWALSRTPGRLAPLLCCLFLAALAGRSVTQIPTWVSSEMLFRQALVVYPDSPAMNNQLGLALRAEGRWDEAIQCDEQSLRLKPDFLPAQYNLAFALAHQGRTDDAITHYHIVLRSNPHDPDCEAGLGEALLEKGQIPEAIHDLQAALAASPDDVLALNALALAFARTGSTADAVQQWRQVERLRPGSADIHYNLAVALTKLHDRPAAQAEWQAALRLVPPRRLAQIAPVR